MRKKIGKSIKSYFLLPFFLVILLFPVTSYALLAPVPGAPTPVFDIGLPTKVTAAKGIITAGATVSTAADNRAQTLKEFVLDPTANGAAKLAMHSITKSVVNWINSGFNGSPAFVQDLNQTLLDVGDAEASRFIGEFVKQGSLQNLPWRDAVGEAALNGYLRSTGRDGFTLQNPYTLDKVSSDPQAFINGDYSKGGLDGWMSVVLNPANSPRGLLRVTQNTLSGRVGNSRSTKLTETTWNNGYLSFRGDCKKTTSSILGGSSASNSNVLSFDGSSSTGGAKGPTDLLSGTPYASPTTLSTTDSCLGKPILTPGALISQSANKYLVDIGADEYISADEFGEVVNALIGQLVGNVLGSGGLAGVSRPSSGGGRSYIDRATDPKQTTGATNSLSLSATFLTTLTNQEAQVIQYKENWTKISSAAQSAKIALGGSSCTIVVQTLTQAGAAISNAVAAIAEFERIKTQLTSDVQTDPTSQSAIVAEATTAFEKLQTSDSLPTVAEIDYANSESEVRETDTDNGISASLLTQMNQIASTKTCPL